MDDRLQKIQKRDWQLWALALFVLFAAVSLVVFLALGTNIGQWFQKEFRMQNVLFLLLDFALLAILLGIYLVQEEVKLKKIQEHLIEEQVSSASWQHQFQELRALFEVSTVMSAKVELPEILNTICEQVNTSLGADRTSVMLYDEHKRTLSCAAAAGQKKALTVNQEVALGKSVAGWVMEHGEAVVLGDDLSHFAFAEFVPKEEKIASAICIPLVIKGKRAGVLSASRFNPQRKFSPEDLKIVSIFAENAAVSIERAQLYREVKESTRQLVQTEKMRALGEMAAGVARDFNNTLAIILGRVELLMQQIQDPKYAGWLESVRHAGLHASEIVKKIQDFTRRHATKTFVSLDLNQIIRDTVELAAPKWKHEPAARGKTIHLSTGFGEISPVEGNPSELKEVFMNLIFNAVEALPEGGTILFQTRLVQGQVEVTVIDNGVGMSEETKQKIFEPFFTTKGPKGTGLGLSVAYGIVAHHGGEIAVDSALGKGTTVCIRLPVHKPAHEQTKVEPKVPKSQELSGARIVIVNGEAPENTILTNFLLGCGHLVKSVLSGREVLDQLRRDDLDLVFLDSALSKSSPFELAAEMKRTKSAPAVVLIGGWGHVRLTQDATEQGIDFVIGRPFVLDEISAVTQKALLQRRGRLLREQVIPSRTDRAPADPVIDLTKTGAEVV